MIIDDVKISETRIIVIIVIVDDMVRTMIGNVSYRVV